ncbi:hypothetical protein T10_1841 [Trichinella papuae]|uniref:Uncharacterized protein n=1 Tax=Trichinella papuae TaxID=268474 RepID=A0A0V1N6S7_9BILA|nr:hypothetical protein T10_1841 [Trichinella papuae]
MIASARAEEGYLFTVLRRLSPIERYDMRRRTAHPAHRRHFGRISGKPGGSAHLTWRLRIGKSEVTEADREKTEFSTSLMLYPFKIMPFGFCIAPVNFQRLMETALRGLTRTA